MAELRYPPRVGTERELLAEYLDWYRDAILRKVEGASEETLRAQLVPSRTTLLGIVKHLAWVEIWWFQMVMEGRDDIPDPWGGDDEDAEWIVGPDETTEEIVEFYKNACDKSRAIYEAHDLDFISLRDVPEKWNLRRTTIHMIEETARHAGHADILRELGDGKTGD